jgi:hypothetical protein
MHRIVQDLVPGNLEARGLQFLAPGSAACEEFDGMISLVVENSMMYQIRHNCNQKADLEEFESGGPERSDTSLSDEFIRNLGFIWNTSRSIDQ